MPYFLVVGGLVLLTVGGDVLVRGAVGLALRFGVSKLLVGMTVVAFCTSAPELVVSLDAALTGAGGLAMGNVVGSNIANILLILGACALIAPVSCAAHVLRRDGASLMAATGVFVGLCAVGTMGPLAGLALLGLLIAVWTVTYRSDKAHHARHADELDGVPIAPWKSLILTLAGLAGLIVGADFLVDGGVIIARRFGVSEAVIGLTLVAIGTSLPELAASGMAACRGHSDVALGNVVGSNLMNLLGIIGIVALITPMPVPWEVATTDGWIMLGVTAGLIALLAMTGRVGRPAGGGFLLIYAGYIWFQFAGRGMA